jgi:hypothetical protein
MPRERLQSGSVGNAGNYLVAAWLLLEGFHAGFADRGNRAFGRNGTPHKDTSMRGFTMAGDPDLPWAGFDTKWSHFENAWRLLSDTPPNALRAAARPV